jgi:hypothetical protein
MVSLTLDRDVQVRVLPFLPSAHSTHIEILITLDDLL